MTAATVPTSVTFPGARPEQTLGEYRHEAKHPMRAWVQDALVTYEEMFELDLQPISIDSAATVCCIQVFRLRQRSASDTERTLITEAVRSLAVARVAMREHERKLLREVL